MSRRVAEGHTRDSSGRTTSKLRRTAVVAVDGVLAVGTGAVAGLFASGAASATVPTPGWTGVQSPVPFGLDAPATNPLRTCRPPPAPLRSPAPAPARTRTPAATPAGSSTRSPVGRGRRSRHRCRRMSGRTPTPPSTTPPARRAARASPWAATRTTAGDPAITRTGSSRRSPAACGTRPRRPSRATPSPATGSDTWLKSVSCPAPGDCVAVGFYSTGPATSSGSSRRSRAGSGPPWRPRRCPTPPPIRPSSWPACRAPPWARASPTASTRRTPAGRVWSC